ncbi:MAG: DUF268 domain-containing protein [Bacteroidia bacterium]|nr:DUF268 domain-containing protein [Bacteroidia bacterium]
MIRHIPTSGGRALDFGCASSYVPLILGRWDYEVVALDRESVNHLWTFSKIRVIQGDILEDTFAWNDYFDLVTNISSVEHVGLSGRYGVEKDTPDGDLIAMTKLRDWLKKDGIMLLTIPVGKDEVFAPLARVYGEKRLPLLLKGFSILHEEYWAKISSDNRWYLVERDLALTYHADVRSWRPDQNIYALGCFVLKKV